VAHEAGADPLEPDKRAPIGHPAEGIDELTARERFAWAHADGSLSLRPGLADRGVVFRPETRLTVLPEDEIELHVSSPIWVCVVAGSGSRQLIELPCHRPSDTWLGSTTVAGELCYASSTHCRLLLADIPWRSHRAVTTVRVCNRTDVPMPLERISVPLPNLELYGESTGRLVTSSIRLTREGDGTDLARLEIDDGPPSYARTAELLTKPRRETDEGGLVHAFAGLF
jgi:hypothetical protein